MNWDISIGYCRQAYGRVVQALGRRFESRAMVMTGERIEYAARLQIRYGVLKHQAQWNAPGMRWPSDTTPARLRTTQARSTGR